MGQVIEINQKRFFTLEDAKVLLPIVRRITQVCYTEVKQVSTQISYTKDKEVRAELEKKVQAVFQRWNQKLGRLGVEAKGMWLVDFDTGEGYYCWHYPEPSIQHFHGYFEGFRGRVRIQ